MLVLTAWAQEPGPAVPTHRLLIEDFEQGIGRWFTNDDQVAGAVPANRCAIYAVQGGPSEEGKQCGRVEFQKATSGWASVSLPVDGRKWAQQGCSKLSMYLRGDGSGEPLRIVLRVQTTRPARDVAYSQVIRLDSTSWEKFSFRSFGFEDSGRNILQPKDIQHIKLLQFAKNGGWGTFRFRVDDIAVEAEAAGPAIPQPDAHAPGKVVSISPDFGKPGVPALIQIGANLGSPPTILDTRDYDTSSWAYALLSDLAPCVVRLQLNDYFDPRHESYNLGLLRKHMDWVQRCNCRPLVCLDVPRAAEDQEAQRKRLYALFVKTIGELVRGRAGSGPSRYYEIFDEPLVSTAFADAAHVVAAYNKLAELVLAADPEARVGGPGFSSAWQERIEAFLKGAKRLDFLSFHFYGTHNVLTESEALLESAYKTRSGDLPRQLSFQQVKRLTKKLRRDRPEIFVTEFALSSARDDRDWCRDERASTGFGAAWLAATVLSGAPYVDKLIHYKLAPGGWGMISHDGMPDTAYWAAWLLRHYAPRGATHLQAFLLDDFTVAAAIKTRTAFNLIIAHAGIDPVELRVSPKNLPPLGEVRDRRISGADRQWKGAILPRTPIQDVLIESPGLVVLQYIPKR